ncbi:formylglycine-generating enzyme family protein [Nannocystaceae bacterium ST9]
MASARRPWSFACVVACSCGAEPPDSTECDEQTEICVEIVDGMAHVPAGPFWMGCRPGLDSSPVEVDCEGDLLLATPFRQVDLSGYWIDVVEVSHGEFAKCLAAGACAPPLDDDWVERPRDWPVMLVNWTHAQAYCEWKGKRLPTEAEWEKAARGIDGRRYPWGDRHPDCDLAVFNISDAEFATGACPEIPGPQPVGSRPAGASPYGVLDMAGNASEWVADWYAPGYADRPARDPLGPSRGTEKVIRGGNYGSWVASAGGYSLRTSIRKASSPTSTTVFADGFRCAKDE